jgi:Ras-related protein Rab-5C
MDDPPYAKAVVVGSMGVGKTALSNCIVSNFFDPSYQATIGVGYSVYPSTLSGHSVSLHLWDTAGMEKYTSLGPIYYRGAHAAIFVFDVTDPQSALDLDGWCQAVADANDKPFYGVVAANKIDLVQMADVDGIERWARGRRFGFVRTSAKTGQNVKELFDMAVQGAFLIKDSQVFLRTIQPETEKRGCC